ncbi:reverse transcriptase domain-containing protein [Tanacetum coccineum]
MKYKTLPFTSFNRDEGENQQSQVGPSGGVDVIPSVSPQFNGRRYENGGIVAIVEGEAHGALGLRGGLLGVQTQSHIGKIIISKLTYNLGGLLLLSPIGFRMELQLGLYVRLGQQRVRYAASCYMNKALTWWNTKVQASGHEAAIGMSWNDFKALFVEELCPSNKIEKLENKFWNNTMVGANHVAYTDRFHELAKLVPHLVTPKSFRIKRILIDEAVCCGTLTKENDKRKEMGESSKQGSTWKDNKKSKTRLEFVATIPPRNDNVNTYPKCAKCYNFHSENAPLEALQDPKVMTGTFSLNNQFATVLFDSGVDYSFISTKFVPLLNVEPCIVNPGYVIEIPDGESVEVDNVIRDCKLEL